MIQKAKNFSPDQRTAIESILGRSIADSEAISILAVEASAPDWLLESWQTAEQLGLDRLSVEEIDAEIAAARKARTARQPYYSQ